MVHPGPTRSPERLRPWRKRLEIHALILAGFSRLRLRREDSRQSPCRGVASGRFFRKCRDELAALKTLPMVLKEIPSEVGSREGIALSNATGARASGEEMKSAVVGKTTAERGERDPEG